MENEGQEQLNYTQAQSQTGLGAEHAPQQPQQTEQSAGIVQWKASEFIDHQKSSLWFIVLALGGVAGGGLMYLITRDILSTVVVVVAAAAFGIYASKKPRTLTYSLTPTNLKIDQKTYRYDEFKSFSLHQEGALYSIVLDPIKRFTPPLTIYFAGDDGEQIFDALAQHLPHEERSQDPIDNLMRKIRF